MKGQAMKRVILLASYGASARESPFDVINRDAATSEVKERALPGDVHLLEGSGGNIVVLADPDSLVAASVGHLAQQCQNTDGDACQNDDGPTKQPVRE
jgi:hypothetical protein